MRHRFSSRTWTQPTNPRLASLAATRLHDNHVNEHSALARYRVPSGTAQYSTVRPGAVLAAQGVGTIPSQSAGAFHAYPRGWSPGCGWLLGLGGATGCHLSPLASTVDQVAVSWLGWGFTSPLPVRLLQTAARPGLTWWSDIAFLSSIDSTFPNSPALFSLSVAGKCAVDSSRGRGAGLPGRCDPSRAWAGAVQVTRPWPGAGGSAIR